jgi:serine/threonine protein kinase
MHMASDRQSVELIKKILVRALDIPAGEEREEFLARACGDDASLRQEIEGLIAACEATGDFLRRDASGELLAGFPDLVGTMIGNYRLLERIGEGGFGDVYRAEQTEPFRREVALKVIKLGMDTKNVVARFEAERQALARMNHPGIARVYDAGATESGRPYFVMELIDGMPIIDYCNRHHLSMPDRIGLFQQVCEAVQHAHQKGVLHRDLKPSNILVTEENGKPMPKIIDFGVAKSLEGRLTEETLATLQEMLIGTPMYMSPEQLKHDSSDIDARSDIYSLGIILYELVAGTTPLEHKTPTPLTIAGMRQALDEEDMPRPSKRFHAMGSETRAIAHDRQIKPLTLEKLLRHDLDWVVMKAIEKERDRRYAEAEALAQDLECYLNHNPVSAGPPSLAHRTKKFVHRHRTSTAISANVGLTMILGICVAIIGFSQLAEKAPPITETDEWKLQPFCRLEGIGANHLALRPDGSLLVTTGWWGYGGEKGLHAIAQGESWTEDKILVKGSTIECPTGVVELPEGIYVVVNNPAGSSVLKVFPDTGKTKILCRSPLKDPHGLRVAPEKFDGPNVAPGDLLVFDNGSAKGKRGAIWAVSRKTGDDRPFILDNPLNEGYLNGSFGPDGMLYTGLSDDRNDGAAILKVSPDGNAVVVLDNFYFSDGANDMHPVQGVAVHPVTGEIFFSCRNRTFAFVPGKSDPRPISSRGRAALWTPDGSRLFLADFGAIWTLSDPGNAAPDK